MPLNVPATRLVELGRAFEKFASPGGPLEMGMLDKVRSALEPEVARMYRTSSDPFGHRWKSRTDGGEAYASKKMAHAFSVKRVPGQGLLIRLWVEWINAADQGHTWPARQQRGMTVYRTHAGKRLTEKQYVSRERRMAAQLVTRQRLLAEMQAAGVSGRPLTRAFRRIDKLSMGVGSIEKKKAFKVGQRTLPARHMDPREQVPPRWGEAARGAVEVYVHRWMSGLMRGTNGGT